MTDISVDPYSSEGVMGLLGVETIRISATEAPEDSFGSLAAGDLLFIDSSHSMKTGSELSRLYLDVIPRLTPGVVIRIHDTYLPYMYSPWVLEDLWYRQETTLLLALLTTTLT